MYLPGGQEVHVDPAGVVAATRYYSFAGQTVAVRDGRSRVIVRGETIDDLLSRDAGIDGANAPEGEK